MHNLGIQGTALAWFKSYLSERTQCVDINGNRSAPKKINISVMQGSILGPLLFLCFINDLPNATKILKLLLFADDTCALDSDVNINILIGRCNMELQQLANWFVVNKISVNAAKCKYIIFHRQKKKLPTNLPNLEMNFNLIGNPVDPNLITILDRIDSGGHNPDLRYYKYLGILIDDSLSLSFHIDTICKKLNRALFCLNRVKHILNTKTLTTLYYSLFHSHLLYCSIILNCATPTLLKKYLFYKKKVYVRLQNHHSMLTQHPSF